MLGGWDRKFQIVDTPAESGELPTDLCFNTCCAQAMWPHTSYHELLPPGNRADATARGPRGRDKPQWAPRSSFSSPRRGLPGAMSRGAGTGPRSCAYVHVQLLSCVRLLLTPWPVARQALPSMGFSRQEYWSELPFPPPGDLPDPGIEPASPALQVDSLPTELPGMSDLKTSKDEMLPPQSLRMLHCVWKGQSV